MTTETAPLGVALLGCGFIGEQHAKALAGVSGARLAVTYDPVAERARGLARRYASAAAGSVAEALGRGDVGAVIVATPSETHRELTVAAAEARKHVLVEKPAALRIKDLV